MIWVVVDSNTVCENFIANQFISRNPKTVGIYRLTMKSNSDNFCASAMWDIMEYINAEGIQIIIYEQSLEDISDFFRFEVINDIHCFKSNGCYSCKSFWFRYSWRCCRYIIYGICFEETNNKKSLIFLKTILYFFLLLG